jgi:hypothetical protein
MGMTIDGLYNTIRSYVSGNIGSQEQEVGEDSAVEENAGPSVLGALSDTINSIWSLNLLRAIATAPFGCEASGPVNEVCDDSYSPPMPDVAVDINMTLQYGRANFHFSVVVPAEGRGSIPAGMQSMWVRFGLEGSNMLEPTGLPMLDVEGFRMLLDLSEEDPIGYVSYRPMRDNIWNEQVYIYEGLRVVRHRVVDWTLPEPEERDVWLAVSADGEVMCGDTACIDEADAEANALVADVSSMLPQNEYGDVDISQLEMAFAYYHVNGNGEYIDANGTPSETPVQIPASRRPAEREYELVPDPEFAGYSAEEFRSMLMAGIPERGIAAMSEEDIDAISLPLRGRLIITDESGRNMQEQRVPEDGNINLGDVEQIGAIRIEPRFYPDSTYGIGFEGFGEQGERLEGERHEGVIPEFIYGGSSVRLALIASCDENEPGYVAPSSDADADADADGIIPGDADGDVVADADAEEAGLDAGDAGLDADYDGLSDGDI